jgi:hypothetical protein
MNWTELLNAEIDSPYKATEGLVELVSNDELDWKPKTGDNWMTVGQLLKHLPTACGACLKGFVTGDWGMPEGVDVNDIPDDEKLPPAAKLPKVASVAEAKELLAADKKVAYEMVAQCSEDDLANKMSAAPWNPSETMPLGRRLLQMVGHLSAHKSQLFYYLKLQGKPVNTMNLWGA